MDVFLFHGKIWRGRAGFADAMIIRRGRIAAVGREAELYPLAAGCDFISCQGRTVIPGLFDACLFLPAAASPLPEGKRGLREAAQTWIASRPWAAKRGAHLCWRSAGERPSRKELDGVWQNAPLVLEDVARRRAWGNTRALALLEKQGIPAAFAGEVSFDGEGRPAGEFSGKACRLIASVIPDPPQGAMKKLARDWLEKAARAGLTSIQSGDMAGLLRPRALPVFRELYRENRRLPRLQFFAPGPLRGKGPQPLERQPAFCGQLTTLEALPRRGWQGGQLVAPARDREELEALLEYLRQRPIPPENPRRLTLLGAESTTPEQLGELGQKGLGVICFPGRLEEKLAEAAGHPGAALENCCAYRTMSRLGARVGFGGLDRLDPFGGLQKAVCRSATDAAGRRIPSREALTVEDALIAYTAGSAWSDFGEDAYGRLEPGYQADLVVLNRDIFACPPEEIGAVRPVLTMAEGYALWREI